MFKEPGPHKQPELAEDGFVVKPEFNQAGVYYCYVAWRDSPYVPGTPFAADGPGLGSPFPKG